MTCHLNLTIKEAIINLLTKISEQVFVTAINKSDLEKTLKQKKTSCFSINKGEIITSELNTDL